MKRVRFVLATFLLVSMFTAAIPLAPARAGAISVDPAVSSEVSEGAVVDTKVGVLAAVACGFGIRYFPVVAAAGVGGIAGVVAVCLYAMFDAVAC